MTTDDASPIQIDQRVPRCDRCGKMINVRGAHLAAVGSDGGRLLFCSGICQDEFTTLFGRSGARGRAEGSPAGQEGG